MFCGNCGKELPIDSKFCLSCGTQISKQLTNSLWGFRKSVILTIGVCLLVTIAVLVIYRYQSNTETTKNEIQGLVDNNPETIDKLSEEKLITQNTTEYNENSQKIFYVKSVANVRKCSSLDCAVLFTLSLNHEITSPYQNISAMPEWLDVTFEDGVVGYINKITLSDERSSVLLSDTLEIPKSKLTTADWESLATSSQRLSDEITYYQGMQKESGERIKDLDVAKDLYTKWSPLVKGTLAEVIATKGYGQAVDAIESERKISIEITKVIESIKNLQNTIIERNGSDLVINTNTYKSLSASFLEKYAMHIEIYRTSATTVADFRKALESLGYTD